MASTAIKEIVTLRLPRQLCDEVRRTAVREGESQSTILRRLLRRGLQTENRAFDETTGGAA
jgi:hypothetical protein